MSAPSQQGVLESLSPDALDELLPELEDIAHDLGKYVGFETRFVGLEAETEELRTALRADLLATRRRGEERWSAWQLWEQLRPAELDGDPDLAAIDAAIAALQQADLAGDRAALLVIAEQAAAVRQASRRLLARARALLDDDEALLP